MQTNAVDIDRKCCGDAVPKVQLLTLAALDGRTRAARRARALAAAFRRELGGPASVAQTAAIERAAALCALAEDTRTRRLAGDLSVTLEDLVRVDSAADRSVRRLGIRPEQTHRHVPLREALLAELARDRPESHAARNKRSRRLSARNGDADISRGEARR